MSTKLVIITYHRCVDQIITQLVLRSLSEENIDYTFCCMKSFEDPFFLLWEMFLNINVAGARRVSGRNKIHQIRAPRD